MKIMKIPLLFFAILLMGQQLHGQDTLLRKLLTVQVEAFNNQDINRLVDNVSEDFKWFYISSDTLILEVAGKEQFRKSMDGYFQSVGKVTSIIESHTIQGNRISFREVVYYKNQKGEEVSSSALGIYEMHEGKITRAWYFID